MMIFKLRKQVLLQRNGMITIGKLVSFRLSYSFNPSQFTTIFIWSSFGHIRSIKSWLLFTIIIYG